MEKVCQNELGLKSASDIFKGYFNMYYATVPLYSTLRGSTPATVVAETSEEATVTQEITVTQDTTITQGTTVTQTQVTVTETLRADSTTIIESISSSSASSQSEWSTRLYVTLFAFVATSMWI